MVQRSFVQPLVVRNLRFRWGEELKDFSDEVIYDVYLEFSGSEDYGDNDAKFPEWFSYLEERARARKG